MQLHTKILIGMGVGAVIGLTLGPTSPLLEADLFEVERAGTVSLLADRDDPDSALPIPDKARLRLDVIETISETIPDSAGKLVEVPAMVRVRFRLTKQMKLLDKSGALQAAIGSDKVGAEATAWLPIEHVQLDGGGILSRPQPISATGARVISWLSPVGELFMRLIKMVIVPLVFASLLVGVAGLGDVRKLGRLGTKTIALYLATTALAVSIGLGLANLLRPGEYVAEADRAAMVAQFQDAADTKVEAAAESPSWVENVLAIVPENIVEAMADSNMLQIIFFALLLGVALTMLKEERSREVVTLFDTIQHAMILIIHMVMAVAPYGVAALLAEVVGQSGWTILKGLVVYAGVVILGLLVHSVVIYGSIVRFMAKLPFLSFIRAIRPAQLIAFSTSSSSATLPVSLECAEQNLGVSNSVASFVIPLGSTVNMDGTALYQGVAAIFVAQVFEIDLGMAAQFGIVLTATAASIGAAGVPGAGMITLAMVLTAAGIPPVGVALILGVDRILDMFRTAINVTGDLSVTAAMAVSEGEKLRVLSPEEDRDDARRGFAARLHRETRRIEPEDEAD